MANTDTGSNSVSMSVPSLQELMSLGGAGSISTTGPDIYGTGDFGDLPVVVKPQSMSFTKPIKGPFNSGTSKSGPLLDDEQTATVNEVLSAGYKMSSDDMKALQQKLFLAGMYQGTGVTQASQIPYGQYDPNTFQAYSNLLKQSASETARGQASSIDTTLSNLIQQQTAINAQSNNGVSTRTSTSYSLSDPETAKGILSNVFQAYLGVGTPDPNSLAAFQTALNSYEKAHPTTTTSTTADDGTGSGTDTTSEGVDDLSSAGRTQFAQDYVMQNQGPQVANYQAATTYYQAAMNALQSPVQLGGGG